MSVCKIKRKTFFYFLLTLTLNAHTDDTVSTSDATEIEVSATFSEEASFHSFVFHASEGCIKGKVHMKKCRVCTLVHSLMVKMNDEVFLH